MHAALTQELAIDGGYDFVHDGAIVGRLVWLIDVSEKHPRQGWWLTIPGQLDELVYQVPDELFGDLPRARARGVSMSLGLAQHLLADLLDGLLDGPPQT